MKKLLLLTLLCMAAVSAIAQTATLRGQLIADNDKKGLPYATISVANASAVNKVIKKFAADDKGNFTTTLQSGKYIITFHFVGMNLLTKTVEVKSGESKVDLGKIEMTESSLELSEVSVVAQRPLVKVEIDKLTYNAKEDPEASTSTVLDLLRKVPLVTVDGEDKIQLKGSSGFKIYVNGKPSNMISSNPSQVLKSMPANSIKDIEVITDPGAKYDAEGVGGIINLVTDKRVDDGYSGSVGVNVDNLGGYGGNAYLSAKYGKFGATGNVAHFQHKMPESRSTNVREDFAPLSVNKLTQNGTDKTHGGGTRASALISYEPDSLNLISVSFENFGGKFTTDSRRKFLSVGSRDYGYSQLLGTTGTFGGMSTSADYQRLFKKKGEMLTFSYRWEHNPNNSDYWFDISDVSGTHVFYPDGYRQRSTSDASGNEHTGQVDYVNPINPKHSIETGAKYIYRDNSSVGDNQYFDVAANAWKEMPSRKNDLEHEQHIVSGYAGYSFKSGKYGVKTGLRGEYTDQNILFKSQSETPVSGNYFDLIPSATFSYQLAPTSSIRFGYNKRIMRPGIWYLNPFVNNADPFNISYGNPNLEAESVRNFDVNYGSFSRKFNFNATLSYAFTNNAIVSHQFVKDGVTNSTFANTGRRNVVGVNLYASWSPTEQLRMTLNGGLDYTELKGFSGSDLQNSGFSGRAFTNIVYTLPYDMRLSFNGGLFKRPVQLQSEMSLVGFHGFSLMKSFLNKTLDVTLSARSPFQKEMPIKMSSSGEGFKQEYEAFSPRRSFSVSVTYRFGDLKSAVKKVQRTISNEDVMKGQSGGDQTGGGM